MNFEQVITSLTGRLEQRHIRYAAIGGFALGVLGVPRATADLDLLVHRDDLAAFRNILETLGYRQQMCLENVSHYTHGDDQWGGIDVIHAFRPHAVAMLNRAGTHAILEQSATIRVLQPEDVIGLKVQAIANAPDRRLQDQADIEALMAHYGASLDWDRLQEYYDLFEIGHTLPPLRARYGQTQ